MMTKDEFKKLLSDPLLAPMPILIEYLVDSIDELKEAVRGFKPKEDPISDFMEKVKAIENKGDCEND